MRDLGKRRRWLHNSFRGHVALGKSNMNAIMRSDSTTPQAKAKAQMIRDLLDDLDHDLLTRVDPQKEKPHQT